MHEHSYHMSRVCRVQLDEWLDYDFPTDIRSHMTGSWTRYRGQTQKWCDPTCRQEYSLRQIAAVWQSKPSMSAVHSRTPYKA